MGRRRSIRRGGPRFFWLRALLAVALLAIAFGHQPLNLAASPEPSTVDLAAYALPDGTQPSICFGNDGASGKGHGFGAGCEACRLTVSIILPEPPCEGTGLRIAAQGLAVSSETPELAFRAFSPAAPPTAPPLA